MVVFFDNTEYKINNLCKFVRRSFFGFLLTMIYSFVGAYLLAASISFPIELISVWLGVLTELGTNSLVNVGFILWTVIPLFFISLIIIMGIKNIKDKIDRTKPKELDIVRQYLKDRHDKRGI